MNDPQHLTRRVTGRGSRTLLLGLALLGLAAPLSAQQGRDRVLPGFAPEDVGRPDTDSAAAPPSRAHRRTRRAVAKPTSVPAPAAQKTDLQTKSAVTTVPEIERLYGQAKPDPAAGAGVSERTPDSPLGKTGDAWKMLAYLVPVLLLTRAGLSVLKRHPGAAVRLPNLLQRHAQNAQQGASRLPGNGLFQALLGGFHLNNARHQGGANIHVIESLPIGGVNLHLVAVRDRLILIGAAGSGVHTLAEFPEAQKTEMDMFRKALQAAETDIDSLKLPGPRLPVVAVVSSLEDQLREARQTLQERTDRMRAAQQGGHGA